MGTKAYIKRLRALACKMEFCNRCGKVHSSKDECPTEIKKEPQISKKSFLSKIFKH